MELIRISDRKLKVMLTPADMCHFELNEDSFGEDSRQMHKTFRLLLDEIRRQTDFDADDRHLSVQYFPSRRGGCEMFISRLQESEETPELPPQAPTERLPAPRRSNTAFRRECAYRFPDLDALLCACRRLRDAGYIGESAAYRDEKDTYYLCFSILASTPFSTPEEWEFLSEYGAVENVAFLKLYILEHGAILCPASAVQQLAALQ